MGSKQVSTRTDAQVLDIIYIPSPYYVRVLWICARATCHTAGSIHMASGAIYGLSGMAPTIWIDGTLDGVHIHFLHRTNGTHKRRWHGKADVGTWEAYALHDVSRHHLQATCPSKKWSFGLTDARCKRCGILRYNFISVRFDSRRLLDAGARQDIELKTRGGKVQASAFSPRRIVRLMKKYIYFDPLYKSWLIQLVMIQHFHQTYHRQHFAPGKKYCSYVFLLARLAISKSYSKRENCTHID